MPRTLLIVDDNRTNREMLRKILHSEYTVMTAGDGQEAVSLLNRHYTEISAVLLDIVMPKLDGFGVLEQMLAIPVLSQIPVIVITGDADPGAEERALACGATDFVVKPFDARIIKRRIENLIRLRETAAMVNALQRDNLTGLWNRETFFRKAAAEIERQPEGYYVLSCVDIDGFKLINDQVGTDKGDQILINLARAFERDCLRDGGLCGRIAADDFIVLYPSALVENNCPERYQAEAAAVDGLQIPVSLSFGRYFVNDKNLSINTMFDRASIAQTTVKGRYDKRIAVYDDSMRNSMLRKQQIINEMRPALKSRQFEAWFQPQYNHSTGALIGAEALARWRHPKLGLISPAEFIPIFERSGFVYELDKYIWEETCAYLRKWTDEGRSPLPVSVNISRNDLFSDGVAEEIVRLTKQYGIDAELLRLEITESAFAESSERVVNVVKELIEHGFIVEIDDFGCGYSSLNTLKDVPAQIIKLDMRFLEGKGNTDRGGNILESIVRMTKWLGMAVIAEGVEEKQQADFLQSIGCNYVQGYLYAKPMPASDYESLANGAGKEEHLIVLETVESLDNNAFWDPKSMDTLIFNSFVGGACIFEWHDKHIDVLRANKKYAESIGGGNCTLEDVLKLDWLKHMDDVSRTALFQAIDRAIETNGEVTFEMVYHDLFGKEGKTYLRMTIRTIARAVDRYLFYAMNDNTTAQREAEEREHEAMAKLSAILQNIDGGVSAATIMDGRMNYVFVNDQFYRMFGYTREQFLEELPNGLRDIVCSEYMPVLIAAVDRAAECGIPVQFEFCARRRDGALIHIRNNSSVCRLPGVDVPVHLDVLNDVTSEKVTEEKLRETDEQLHAIMANMSGGVSAATMDGDKSHYIFANEQFYSMLGYTKEQFYSELPDGLESIIYPDDLARTAAAIHANEASGGTITTFFRVIRRDGRVIWMRASGSICRIDGIEKPVHIAVHTDITAEREAERKLRDADEQLQLIMQNVNCGIAAVLTTEHTPQYLFMNDQFCTLFGYTKEQYLSECTKDVMDVIHPDDRKAVYEKMSDIEHSHGRISMDYRAIRRDQSIIWVRSVVTVCRMGGIAEPVYIAVCFEMTQEIENEQRFMALNESLQNMMDDTPGGFTRIQLMENGTVRIIYINKGFCSMRGISDSDIMEAEREDAISAVHPDDVSLVEEKMREALVTGKTRSLVYRLRCGSGEYERFSVFMRMARGEKGEVFFNVYYTDLTEREKRDFTVRDTMPFILSAIMASSTDLSFVKDKDYRYLCCSRPFAEMVGLKDASDVVGKTDYDLFNQDIADRYRSDDLVLYASGDALVDYIEAIPSDDGIQHYSNTSKFVLKDSVGEVIGLYGCGRDITDVRAAYDRLKLLTDSIPGGIASFECTPNRTWITYFNDGFCHALGYAREEFETVSDTGITSITLEEDATAIREQVLRMRQTGEPIDCVFRVHNRRGNGHKWIHMRGSMTERRGETMDFNAVLYDVSERQAAIERLRLSEELFRTAISMIGTIIGRYDIRTKCYAHNDETLLSRGFGKEIANVPHAFIDSGSIAPESFQSLTDFYDRVRAGNASQPADVRLMLADGQFHWCRIAASIIFDASNNPVQAIIVTSDISEQREKEAVYTKWQQSIKEKSPESYTLFRWNLNRDEMVDASEGSLIHFRINRHASASHNTQTYARECIYPEDRERYTAFVNSDTMLAAYYRGKRAETLEYREQLSNAEYRYLKLTVELVKYPNSSDVCAYMMYENIDRVKRSELMAKELAETDPLTGVLNRAAFSERVGMLLANTAPDALCALLMLDIDGFKLINDTFGHAAGDQALIEMADSMRSILRTEDLLARFGGDEFLIFLRDVRHDTDAEKKAKQICSILRKAYSTSVQVSASVGIAMYPRDGSNFEQLYKNADVAMYAVKEAGKDNVAFYDANAVNEDGFQKENEKAEPASLLSSQSPSVKLRRMLIVEDSDLDAELLKGTFENEFRIERVKDGNSALIRLRHFGSSIAVVLLDLIMQGIDGYEVLRKMRQSREMQDIPVVVVSGIEDREGYLNAIRCGATDFVSKPIDPDVLRIRVRSAVSKAENERLRAQNSYLKLQNDDVIKYKTVLDRTGVSVVQYDYQNGSFTYDSSISQHIAGCFDERKLWRILLSDFVADSKEVQTMQCFISDIANDRSRLFGTTVTKLKTPQNKLHRFRLDVYKLVDEFSLTDKLIMTFMDLDSGEGNA